MSDLILKVAIYGMLGFVLCAAYCSALRWNVQLYCDRASLWKAAVVHVLRVAVVGAAFTLAARQGVVALMSSFGGFVGMRTIGLSSQMELLGRTEGRPSQEQPNQERRFRKA
jgi:N-ATPase, AtpR subunit